MTAAAARANDGEVTLEGIDRSLSDLLKAADATEVVEQLRKGDPNPVENSGHVDERGTVGGGRGDMGDSGSLDPMMIGKLAEAGIDAGTIADFAGFMRGKAFGRDEEDEDEEEMEGKKKGKGMRGKRRASPSPSPSPSASASASSSGAVGKYADRLGAHMEAYFRERGSLKGYKRPSAASFLAPNRPSPSGGGSTTRKSMDAFRQDADVRQAIDVSPYLEAMTARTAEQLDGVTKQLRKSHRDQTGVNRAMAGALYQMGTLLKSQSEVIEELRNRLGMVERQPNQPRGVTRGAQVMHKSLPSEAGAGVGELRKSEVVSTLSYMRIEKGMRHVGSHDIGQAVIMLESGGQIDPEVLGAAESFLATNPREAQTARAYH